MSPTILTPKSPSVITPNTPTDVTIFTPAEQHKIEVLLNAMFGHTNRWSLAELRYVLFNTVPTKTAMHGDWDFNFRPITVLNVYATPPNCNIRLHQAALTQKWRVEELFTADETPKTQST